MEVDFDKEIDAMLRKAQRDGPVLVGDFTSSRHLDADEISAFAENAMPEKSRSLHMAHLADCDRCRKILSNLLVMNSEAAPATVSPSVITIAERAPWYKRLFLFPNLAYVMGSLVLVFSAFLGYTIIQKSGSRDVAGFQGSSPAETKGGPNFQHEPAFPGDQMAANSMANSAANTASSAPMSLANANTSIADLENTRERGPAVSGSRAGENNFTLDGVDTNTSGIPAAAPPPVTATQPALAAPKDARDRDDAVGKEKAKAEGEQARSLLLQEGAKNDSTISKQQQSNLPTQSGPMRNNENQYNRQLENLDRKGRAAKRSTAPREEESASGTRSVAGKTFERKQGVWYDVTYQSRPTINVRRGSAEFNKLDAGLKSIANSLSGTAVIVWGAKAYRIQ